MNCHRSDPRFLKNLLFVALRNFRSEARDTLTRRNAPLPTRR
jgi:hypothetical protein